ncbi:MAG TPA: non-homologous end-joining DNA ligase [Pseudonocardiaceae bacterium]|nr:non-homologous end-joining DNA ligase [Pseudonocardiaceae bacterium]
MAGDAVTVLVEGQRLRLSNLDKVLYPAAGFTKGEVLHYYTRIAPAMLPHLAGRPVTMRRYPDGVAAEPFYDKDASRHAPDWVRVVRLPTPGSTRAHDEIGYAIIDGLPALIWAANLAGLELHVPQWTVDAQGRPRPPDLVVFDLDPGPSTTVVECARVAEAIRKMVTDDGLVPCAKTSGSTGLQVYAPVRVSDPADSSAYARQVAERLAAQRPGDVVARMAKAVRRGKVLVDWSQNNPAKTTVAPYSLRGREQPTVSTPVTWEEIAGCEKPGDLVFTAEEVVQRVQRLGDLFAPLNTGPRSALPALPAYG